METSPYGVIPCSLQLLPVSRREDPLIALIIGRAFGSLVIHGLLLGKQRTVLWIKTVSSQNRCIQKCTRSCCRCLAHEANRVQFQSVQSRQSCGSCRLCFMGAPPHHHCRHRQSLIKENIPWTIQRHTIKVPLDLNKGNRLLHPQVGNCDVEDISSRLKISWWEYVDNDHYGGCKFSRQVVRVQPKRPAVWCSRYRDVPLRTHARGCTTAHSHTL